ncbi:MAG: DUF1028 domain-containing protein [Bacteroidetes bacterium]|nr:DUF1028 domain-containing protein [Bacteroidota bacterium]
MKKLYAIILIAVIVSAAKQSYAQDTFSICAFDSATGQVGSAGATCIKSPTVSAIIISDVHPGIGVVHTQAYYYSQNQNYAKSLMNMGLMPQQIIDSLKKHDVLNDSTRRQYGIVDMVHKLTAQFTGANCDTFKNHIHGPYYSIQGNTLLGQQILDSMQSRFLNTQGTLACRLMAALQGAKVIGADNRCISYGVSTFSAFIRVANSSDSAAGPYFLDKTVNTYPPNAPAYTEPIDSLQKLFNNWGGCSAFYVSSLTQQGGIKIFPNPASGVVNVQMSGPSADGVQIEIYNVIGERVYSESVIGRQSSVIRLDAPSGIYFLQVKTSEGIVNTKIIINK